MTVEVEPASPRDLPAMMRLMERLAEEHAALDEAFVTSGEWYDSTRRMFLERLGTRDHFLAVARHDGQVAGMVTATMRHSPGYLPARRAAIENLVVDARQRRRGVGRALVAAAVAWCERRGAECLELSVACANEPALAFWRALGFRPVIVRLTRPAGGREP